MTLRLRSRQTTHASGSVLDLDSGLSVVPYVGWYSGVSSSVAILFKKNSNINFIYFNVMING